MADEDKIQEYCKAIGDAYEAGRDQRDAANEDIRFCNVDGGMWEDWQERLGENRAKLEFDVTADFVNRYVGEQKLNRATVLFGPDDDDTSDDDADLLNSIYRADFADNDGMIAQDVAEEEVAECGIGHFKLLSKYTDEEDPENMDQDIHWAPIYNSYSNVIWDPQAKRIDKKDANWCCVLNPYTKKTFEKTYPDAQPVSAYRPYTRGDLNWCYEDQIMVAEYYDVTVKTETVYVYRNVELEQVHAYRKDELDEETMKADNWEFVRERKIKRRIITKSVFTSQEYLEKPTRIAGKYIPVIPMYGYVKYIDNKEYYRGLVRKLKDPNRLLNSGISRYADTSAASPERIPVFYEEEIEGYEQDWADKTKDAYKIRKPMVDNEGNPVTLPMQYLDPPTTDPATNTMLEFTSNFVQRATGNAPQDTIDPDASGKAINALRVRENLNTQTITDNKLIALKHSGDVYLSMANEIYTGLRSKRTMAVDGSESRRRINTEGMVEGKPVLTNTIAGRKFKAHAEVGPQYETDREATVDTLERMIEKSANLPALQKYTDIIVATWLKNIRGTGLESIKEYNRKQMILMGIEEPETDEEIQMVQAMANQPDPDAQMKQAVTMQQVAEARNLEASAENKEADTQKKLAETQKVMAETAETLEGIGRDGDGVRRLVYNPQTGGIEGANGSRTARPN